MFSSIGPDRDQGKKKKGKKKKKKGESRTPHLYREKKEKGEGAEKGRLIPSPMMMKLGRKKRGGGGLSQRYEPQFFRTEKKREKG